MDDLLLVLLSLDLSEAAGLRSSCACVAALLAAASALVSAAAPVAAASAWPLLFARSFLSAISSIRICLSSCSLILCECRLSPSSFAILAFISARSMSHAFLARSWLCHSIWRKRITPVACQSPGKSKTKAVHGHSRRSNNMAMPRHKSCTPCNVYSAP